MTATAPTIGPRKLSKAGKRQLVLIGAVALLLLAVIMMAIKVAETNTPTQKAPKTKPQKTTIAAPGSVPEETVAAVTERRLAELQATIKLQDAERDKRLKEAELKAQKERDKDRASRAVDTTEVGSSSQPQGGATGQVDQGETGRLKLFDPSRMGTNDRARARDKSTADNSTQPQQVAASSVTTLSFGRQSEISQSDKDNALSGGGIRPEPLIDTARGLASYEEIGKALRTGTVKSMSTSPKANAPLTSETYLPSGTFFRVQTMNGMDAPAGGQAQNNPQPVLMVVSDFGNMPNDFRANVKHCFVIGSAWGDLSAERAMARTESLSCIRPSGEVIDVPISGFVVGPDGRNGFRGRVVTKQGQVLANALWTGTLGAFGDVAKELNSGQIVVGSGVVTQQSPSTSEILRRGALGGMGEAAKSLSQYYINLADKLYPVIETDAGLTAEVVLTRGVAIKDGQGQGGGSGPDLAAWAAQFKLPSLGMK